MESVEKTTRQVKETLKRMIARRAYEKWVGRGYQHGNDMQDWFEAEQEMIAELKMLGAKLPIPDNIKALNREGQAAICPQPVSLEVTDGEQRRKAREYVEKLEI